MKSTITSIFDGQGYYMSGLFMTPGTLSVSIGDGFMSAHEAASLKTGDLVKSGKIAGFPATVLFNGNFLCHCEVVILSDIIGVRVTSMEETPESDVAYGVKDEATEILPFSIVLGSIRVSLRELSGIGPGSYISLGKLYSEDEDAFLEIAGIAAAKGKVVCIYNNLGIRLSSVANGNNIPASPRSTGNVFDERITAEYTKSYNFKRPDKFSRNAIDRIRGVHRLFARDFGDVMEKFNMEVLEVHQHTFKEALDSYEESEAVYLSMKNRRPTSPRYGLAAIRQGEMRPSKLLLEEKDTEYPVSGETKSLITEMISADGRLHGKPVFAIVTPNGLHDNLDALGWDTVATYLRGAWKNILDLYLELDTKTAEQSEIEIISGNEFVISVLLGSKKDPYTKIILIYPYITLEPFMRILS